MSIYYMSHCIAQSKAMSSEVPEGLIAIGHRMDSARSKTQENPHKRRAFQHPKDHQSPSFSQFPSILAIFASRWVENGAATLCSCLIYFYFNWFTQFVMLGSRLKDPLFLSQARAQSRLEVISRERQRRLLQACFQRGRMVAHGHVMDLSNLGILYLVTLQTKAFYVQNLGSNSRTGNVVVLLHYLKIP